MQKLLCNVQKFRINAMPNVWLAMSKKWKSTVDFMVFHPANKIPSVLQLHQGQNLKQWKLLYKKVFVRETNFHIRGTWFIRRHYPRHCAILGRKHIYSHLAHSRRVHILGHTTECSIALGQCSCSKTSVMVFCVSKGYKPFDWSLTYQVLKMNTAHPQARLEFQLSEGRVNRLGRSDQYIRWILLDCQSQLGQKGLCRKRCFSLCLLSHLLALFHDGLRYSVIPSLSRGGSEWAV